MWDMRKRRPQMLASGQKNLEHKEKSGQLGWDLPNHINDQRGSRGVIK